MEVIDLASKKFLSFSSLSVEIQGPMLAFKTVKFSLYFSKAPFLVKI